MRLYDSVGNVLKRLDDYPAVSSEQVWTRAELELYLEEGYNAFARQTRCIFDMFYPENVPPAGNYVAKWERNYFATEMIAVGLLNYTGGYWERDYAEASDTGPINSTQPWEASYLSTTFGAALHPLPEDVVAVDRVTHDFHAMSPEFTRWFESNDRDFEETEGTPQRFSLDRYGIGGMRVVPAGEADASTYSVIGTYGILRLLDTVTDDIEGYGDGLYCYWKLDEPSGTRYAAVGDYDFTEYNSVTVSSTTGKVDDAATFAGGANGPYLYKVGIPITGSFTLAAWANVSSGTFYVLSGSHPLRLTITDAGVVSVSMWDPTSGNEQTATVTTGVSIADDWVFVVVRFDQTNFVMDMRFYGFGAYNATTHASTGDAWTNAFTTINLYLSYTIATGPNWGTSAGSVDEIGLFRGYLTDNECDALYAAFGTWAGTGAIGTYGSLREVEEHFPMGGQYGIPRRMYYDTDNTRVEYFRLGKSLDEYPFELPDRFVKYPEFYACAKALERDGPGQDLKLAGHFMERFGDGVRRMVLRLGESRRAVTGKIGSAGRVPTKPALARLPWRYGRQIRRGY